MRLHGLGGARCQPGLLLECLTPLRTLVSVSSFQAAEDACMQDSLAAVESALRRLGRLMPGYDLQEDGRLLELHLWQNFVSCLEEARS